MRREEGREKRTEKKRIRLVGEKTRETIKGDKAEKREIVEEKMRKTEVRL